MSFDLGDWAKQLSCDMCSSDPSINLGPSINLSLSPNYFDNDLNDLPDDFWEEPPDPTDSYDFSLPDPHPYFEFPDSGFIIGIEGTF